MQNKLEIIELPTFSDKRGNLTILESQLSFKIMRSYWIYGADGYTRGGHRHHKNIQALVAISGSVSVYVNNNMEEKTFLLNNPNQCLIIEPEYWHQMTFFENSLLLVFASEKYNKDDYIDEPYPS